MNCEKEFEEFVEMVFQSRPERGPKLRAESPRPPKHHRDAPFYLWQKTSSPQFFKTLKVGDVALDLNDYFSLAYSDLAVMRIGMSGSASFQRAKKSWYAARVH